MSPHDRRFLELALNSSPVFGAMGGAAIAEIVGAARRIDFGPGAVLCRAAEVPGSLYLVRTGRISLVATSSEGNQMTLSLLGQGQWATWLGIIDPAPLGHELKGSPGGAALAISGNLLRHLFAMYPAAYPPVIAEIGKRMRGLMGLMEHAALHGREQKLARLLFGLAQGSGENDRASMTHSELALLLGCSRQTLVDTLAQLEDRGLVLRGYGAVRIIDALALKRFAG